jgi:nucleoid DNA-binding protein
MNERLSLQDLIDLLAKKQEITKKDAEVFLRELIAVVTENIEANESVKIKDLGTFKLVKVNARKSVDVNTGEAIEIAAHYKLSFNPDKLLKEAVNRPFAHFGSVVLEEGVTFDNIESEIEEEKGEELEDDVTIEEEITGYIAVERPKAGIEEKLEGVENETKKAIQPIEIINTGISEEEVVEELVGEAVEPESVKEEEKSKQEAAPVPDSIISKIKEEAASHNINIEDILLIVREDDKKSVTSKPKVKIEDEIERNFEDGDLADEDVVPPKKGICKRYITFALFIFLIIAGFVAGGLYYQKVVTFLTKGSFDTDNNMIVVNTPVADTPVADTPVADPQADIILADTLAPKPDTMKKGAQAPNPLSQDRGRDMQAPQPSVPVKQAKAVTPKTPVNTPLGVETIQPGHTLRNIALKYYGNKSFWVYIYEENKDKIKNFNNVPLGTKLTIPAPVKYGINPQDEASVKKARAQEGVLYKQADIIGYGR